MSSSCDGLEAEVDALRVVEAVDAEQHVLGVAELLAQLLHRQLDLVGGGLLGDRLEVDRDGERLHDRGVPPRADHTAVAGEGEVVDLAEATHPVQDVAGVGLGLDADHVGAEEAGEQLGPPRQAGEQLERGEGDVEVEADAGVGALLPDHLRDELQLVVVHPHACRPRPARRRRRRRSAGSPCGTPPTSRGGTGGLDGVVEERPDRLVAGAAVVVVDLLRREQEGGQRDALELEALGIADVAAVPADPGARAAPA